MGAPSEASGPCNARGPSSTAAAGGVHRGAQRAGALAARCGSARRPGEVAPLPKPTVARVGRRRVRAPPARGRGRAHRGGQGAADAQAKLLAGKADRTKLDEAIVRERSLTRQLAGTGARPAGRVGRKPTEATLDRCLRRCTPSRSTTGWPSGSRSRAGWSASRRRSASTRWRHAAGRRGAGAIRGAPARNAPRRRKAEPEPPRVDPRRSPAPARPSPTPERRSPTRARTCARPSARAAKARREAKQGSRRRRARRGRGRGGARRARARRRRPPRPARRSRS